VIHGFSAESGGGAGGTIDVQTRSGLNQPHGDAFVFLQNGALNGTPPLAFTAYKPDENRIRAGLALGGTVQRDKTFYYLAAEHEIAHGQDTNDLRPASRHSRLLPLRTPRLQHSPRPSPNKALKIEYK
jgi:hypothetical protein